MTEALSDLYQEMLDRMGTGLTDPENPREGWLPGRLTRGQGRDGSSFGLMNALSPDYYARDENGQQDFYTDSERLVASCHFCFLHLQYRIQSGMIFLRELDDATQIVESLCRPVFAVVNGISNGKFFGYDLDADQDFVALYASDYRVAELLRERICVNILLGFPMPRSARELAYNIFNSAALSPTKAKPSMVDRDTLFRALAKRVSGRVGLPLGEGKIPKETKGGAPSSALVVRSVFFAFGIHLNRSNALSLLNKSHERERDGALYHRLLSPMQLKLQLVRGVAKRPIRFRFEAEMKVALDHLATEKPL